MLAFAAALGRPRGPGLAKPVVQVAVVVVRVPAPAAEGVFELMAEGSGVVLVAHALGVPGGVGVALPAPVAVVLADIDGAVDLSFGVLPPPAGGACARR